MDGRPLPAVIAREAAEGDWIETVVDSGRLGLAADGSYDQRVWIRVARLSDAALLGRPNLADRGRWARTAAGGYTLATTYQAWRADREAQPLATGGGVLVREQLVHEVGGPVSAAYQPR